MSAVPSPLKGAKHPGSPLPWMIDKHDMLVDALGIPIYTQGEDEEDKANRCVIITAVNAHDRLLAAAKGVIEIDSYGIRGLQELYCAVTKLKAEIDRAERALP